MIYKWGFTASEAIAFQRFMRPGCVVGPQQHFLYANQHIWVKWAALDSVKRSSTPSSQVTTSASVTTADSPAKPTSASQRAATPPPQTEGHPAAPVPGQPRKTPGAKSRHGIALPETNDDNQEEPEAIMIASTSKSPDKTGGVLQPPRAEADDSGMELDDVEDAIIPRTEPAPPHKASSHSRPSPAASSRPGSRIAKSKSPLTTNLDNRPMATASGRSASSVANVPRSKTAKNLGVLSDNKPSHPSTTTTDRYNLRQASRGSPGPAVPNKPAVPRPARSTRPAPPEHGAQSPSRLPTARSGATKRKGAISPSQPAGREQLNGTHDVFTADQPSRPQPPRHSQQVQQKQNASHGSKMTRLRKKSLKETDGHQSVKAAA